MRTEQELEDAVRKYGMLVFRLAVAMVSDGMLAEDIRQNVFLKYYLSNNSFQSDKALEAWLARVTVNEGRSLLRSSWHKKHVLSDQVQEVETMPDPAGAIVLRDEILEALQHIPARYRAAIHLVYGENYSLNMLSEVLQIQPSSAAALISRARKALRKQLEVNHEG